VIDDDGRRAGDGDFDAHVEMPAVVAMSMREFDEYSTPHEAGIKLLQPGHALLNVRFERRGVRQPSKRDLCRDDSHGVLLLVDNRCRRVRNADAAPAPSEAPLRRRAVGRS
jgi:hypothetical protein